MIIRNHTPGQWHVEKYTTGTGRVQTIIQSEQYNVCRMDVAGRARSDVFFDADSDLIAAAKDMFKALLAQEIAYANERGEDIFPAMKAIGEVELYESGRDLQEWANELREAALAKANREQEGEKG